MSIFNKNIQFEKSISKYYDTNSRIKLLLK